MLEILKYLKKFKIFFKRQEKYFNLCYNVSSHTHRAGYYEFLMVI